jgi:hypothetical protein
MAHVFAQANVCNGHDFRTFLFDCPECFLHDSIFGIGASGLFIFCFGDSEKQDRLQAELLRALGFIDNFVEGKLKNARHARDLPASVDLFAYEQREYEIVRGEIGLADKVAKGRRTAQSARSMDQFSHATRLRIST